jgi:hypothetical protein
VQGVSGWRAGIGLDDASWPNDLHPLSSHVGILVKTLTQVFMSEAEALWCLVALCKHNDKAGSKSPEACELVGWDSECTVCARVLSRDPQLMSHIKVNLQHKLTYGMTTDSSFELIDFPLISSFCIFPESSFDVEFTSRHLVAQMLPRPF